MCLAGWVLEFSKIPMSSVFQGVLRKSAFWGFVYLGGCAAASRYLRHYIHHRLEHQRRVSTFSFAEAQSFKPEDRDLIELAVAHLYSRAADKEEAIPVFEQVVRTNVQASLEVCLGDILRPPGKFIYATMFFFFPCQPRC